MVVGVVHITYGISAAVKVGEMLFPALLLIHARYLALRYVAMAAEEEHLSQRALFVFLDDQLAELVAELLIAACTVDVSGSDSSAVDIRFQTLRAGGSDAVVEVGGVVIVSEVFELQTKIIVVSVAWHRRLLAGLYLVHLESTGHVLAVTNHGYRYITYEHSANDRVLLLLMHALEDGTNAVGDTPTVDDGVDVESVELLYTLRVSVYLCFSFGITLLIYYNGKSVTGLGLQTCGEGQEK